MPQKGKRIGRPVKEPRGKRAPLGLKVNAATKRRIDAEARAAGLTQSQVAERLIEQAFQYRQALGEFDEWKEKLRADQAAIESGNLEVVLRQKNWKKVHGAKFGAPNWISADNHGLPPSGFVDPEPEQKASAIDPRLEAALETVVSRAVKAALAERNTP